MLRVFWISNGVFVQNVDELGNLTVIRDAIDQLLYVLHSSNFRVDVEGSIAEHMQFIDVWLPLVTKHDSRRNFQTCVYMSVCTYLARNVWNSEQILTGVLQVSAIGNTKMTVTLISEMKASLFCVLIGYICEWCINLVRLLVLMAASVKLNVF
jgi:hypothetical protein